MCVKIRGHIVGIGSLLPPCGLRVIQLGGKSPYLLSHFASLPVRLLKQFFSHSLAEPHLKL